MDATLTHDAVRTDPRYRAIRAGLEQLTTRELERIRAWPEPLLYDGGNYDEASRRYCPLAVALGIPALGTPMTNIRCARLIGIIGGQRGPFLYNQLKGLEGEFYRDHRAADLNLVLDEVLAERYAGEFA